MVSTHWIQFIVKKAFSAISQTITKIARLVTLINFYFATNPVGINALKVFILF